MDAGWEEERNSEQGCTSDLRSGGQEESGSVKALCRVTQV